MLGSLVLLYFLTSDSRPTDVIAPIVTFVLGVFGGLLAPSPVQRQG